MLYRIRNCLAMLSLVLPGLALAAAAQPQEQPPQPTLTTATQDWNTLLTKHVRRNGGVDYRGLKGDQSALNAFIKAYASLDLSAADDRTKKAAYINLYNATMMHNLLRYAQEHQIDVGTPAFLALEIKELRIPGGNIWNGEYTVTLAGQQVTLDDIEHRLLRGKADEGPLASLKVKTLDPRVHSAVNCAALSCPRVRELAYTPGTVDTMLNENMQEWLSDDRQFHKANDDKLRANSIVFWYYDDFDGAGKAAGQGGAGDWLAPFIGKGAPDAEWKVKHLKAHFNNRSQLSLKLSSAFEFVYDWHVNDVRNRP